MGHKQIDAGIEEKREETPTQHQTDMHDPISLSIHFDLPSPFCFVVFLLLRFCE